MRKRRKIAFSPPEIQTAPDQLSIGEILFSREYLDQVARETGFVKRACRKISPFNLLASLTEQCLHRSPSYNNLASTIESNGGTDPSRQAVALRLGEPFVDFLKTLLGEVISRKIDPDAGAGKSPAAAFRGYQRVLVQDSTVIRLPDALFASFSGVSNGHSSVCNARIQGVYDLVSGKFIEFSIDSYSKNDQLAAPELEIREGDLVLRDRGYLTAGEIQRHVAAGADFIYRHKTKTVYLDPDTRLPVDLAALLRSRGKLDMEVLTGEGTRVRLLAAPVDPATAELRRMRAKKENKGHNPSAAVLELMDWTIFITNIPAAKAGFAEILGIYGLRWRIEVIFKAWKSHLNFDVMHRASERQVGILIRTRLLVIAAASNLYRKFEDILWSKYLRRLSFLKFMEYLGSSTKKLLRVLDPTGDLERTGALERALVKYCCYEKRNNRMNFPETWEFLSLT